MADAAHEAPQEGQDDGRVRMVVIAIVVVVIMAIAMRIFLRVIAVAVADAAAVVAFAVAAVAITTMTPRGRGGRGDHPLRRTYFSPIAPPPPPTRKCRAMMIWPDYFLCAECNARLSAACAFVVCCLLACGVGGWARRVGWLSVLIGTAWPGLLD